MLLWVLKGYWSLLRTAMFLKINELKKRVILGDFLDVFVVGFLRNYKS